MKALYSRKELYHISFKDASVPAERYLFKFENQRKEISKLKLHEKDFLFRVMRTLYKPNGKKKYNIYDIEELKECLFYWIILLHSNMTMVFDGFVPGLKNNPMSEKEKQKNKRFFKQYLKVWKEQVEIGQGPYLSIIKPAVYLKLKNWRDYIYSNNLPVELLKQKIDYIYACFFNIYYHVKLYFDEKPHSYVLRRINGIDVIFNVYSYVHIYSRHYIPNMNQDLGMVSLNPEIETINLDELPDSILDLLERYNESFPIKSDLEFCLFTGEEDHYILWLKYKRLNETKNEGFEVRSFYRCTEKCDLEKFIDGSYIPIVSDIT